jgi:hypothetical protein
MAKEYIHDIVVSSIPGQLRPFPIDMLRYDRLTPKREADSSDLAASFSPNIRRYLQERHREGKDQTTITVCLTRFSFKDWTPTTSRWQSFGWNVIDHSTRRI